MDLLCFTVAAWFRFLAGEDDRGRPLPVDDPLADRLRDLALRGGRDPRPLLGLREVFRRNPPELGHAHPWRKAPGEILAVDEPVRLGVAANEGRGKQHLRLLGFAGCRWAKETRGG